MKKILLITTVFVMLILPMLAETSFAFSGSNVIKGATGNDVVELQARLQNIGYYRGKIDGMFGYETYWALRNFQKNFGLPVTSSADKATRDKLEEASHYNEKWVLAQISAGNEFTYYQGVPIEKQVKKATAKAPTKSAAPTTKPKETPTPAKTPAAPAKTPVAPAKTPAAPAKTPAAPAKTPVAPAKTPAAPAKTPAAPAKTPVAPAKTPAAPAKTPVAPAKTPTPTVPAKQESVIPPGFSANDLKLLANAVYGESRGESYEGQVAVAAVILNRVESASFPNSVSGVIFQPGAFVAVSDGQIYLTPNETAKRAVVDAINGWDPTENAIYYFNPETATNKWIWGRPQVKKIGKHIFCR